MADEFYGKGITVASGFDLSAKSPLDTRNVVNTIEERDAHVFGNRAYEGMKVYVLADKKEYRYNGANWEVVGGLTDEQLDQLRIAYEHSQSTHITQEDLQGLATETYVNEMLGGKKLVYLTQAEYDILSETEKNDDTIVYNITDAIENSGGLGATEVLQGETEPTEESVLLWIDTASDENMVGNNLSDALLSEFRGSISSLNTRVTTLEAKESPIYGDGHTHNNKEVLDRINQTYFDEWSNKSDFSGSYNDLTDKPNLTIYTTKTYVDNAINEIDISGDLINYALKTEIPTKTSNLTNDSGYLTSIPSEYVTETELDSKGYLTEHQDISNLATKNELNSKANLSDIPTVTNDLTNELKANYDTAYTHSQSAHAPSNAQKNSDITKTEIEDKLIGNITSHTHSQYLTEHQDISTLALKSELPTKTSDLTNDSGYLSSIPSEYITETELASKGYATETYVNTKISGCQAKTDNALGTTDKTIVGAINEILSMLKNSEKDTLTLSCNFENNVAGSAYGAISLISNNAVNDGNYEIRWANNDGILNSYKAIDTCSLNGDTSAHSYNFISTNAIPVEATKIAVLKDGNIIKSYNIPSNKLITSQKIYSFGLLSDVHVDGDGNDEAYSESDFNAALTFYSSENVNTICFSGDVTCDGRESDVTLLKSIKNNFSSINYYTARGNHDCKSVCADLSYYTTNIEPNGLYFEKIINNDVFLFLGMANENYADTIFTTEELDWLEGKLETYRNQRVFLIEHVFIPPVGNIGSLYPYSSLSSSGATSKRFMDMMAHYRNVILCTGHSHLEFELQRVGDNANCSQRTSALCHRIHTPSCTKPRANDSTTADTSANTYNRYAGSQGYLIDVYDNFIILKGRDFIENKYLPLAQYIIDTTPITIEPSENGGGSEGGGNYETVTGYTWEQGTIDKTTGEDKDVSTDIRTSSIIIDSNYDYFISTTKSVGHLALYGYDSNGGYLGRFGGNSSGYVSVNESGSASGIVDKYVVNFPNGINTMRLRIGDNAIISDGSYIQVIRKLRNSVPNVPDVPANYVTNGLSFYIDSNNGVTDLSGNNVSFTNHNGLAVVDGAFSFRNSQYLELLDWKPTATNELTVEIYFKGVYDSTITNTQYVYGYGDASANRTTLGYKQTSDQRIDLRAYIEASSSRPYDNVPMTDYSHVVYSITSNQFKYYLNGTVIDSCSISISNQRDAITSNVFISKGYNTKATGQLSADVKFIRIYDRCLTDAEVQQNYNSINNSIDNPTNPPEVSHDYTTDSLGLYLNGSEATNTTSLIKDLSGNGNDFVATGITLDSGAINFANSTTSRLQNETFTPLNTLNENFTLEFVISDCSLGNSGSIMSLGTAVPNRLTTQLLTTSIKLASESKVDLTYNLDGSNKHHYMIIKNGGNVALYVDNVQVATQTYSMTPVNITSNFVIGLKYDLTSKNHFNGKLYLYRLYTKALTDTERNNNYNDYLSK